MKKILNIACAIIAVSFITVSAQAQRGGHGGRGGSSRGSSSGYSSRGSSIGYSRGGGYSNVRGSSAGYSNRGSSVGYSNRGVSTAYRGCGYSNVRGSSVGYSNRGGGYAGYRGGGYARGNAYAYNRGGYGGYRGSYGYRGGYGYGGYGRYGYGYGRPYWGSALGYDFRRPVYFPGYNVFYDPYRCGYVYWQNNAWLFSAAIPAFLDGVDLGLAQMQYINGMPYNLPPEDYYGYIQQYPSALSANLNVGGGGYGYGGYY